MVQLLIKPVSSHCQMQCRYCFYADVAEHRQHKFPPRMEEAIAERMIKKVLQDSNDGETIHFAFQGGEPTLAGLSFYEHFVEMVSRYQKPNQVITYALQTNGCLIDERWCAFFQKHDVLIGISIDGWRKHHDSYRLLPQKSSYAQIMKALHSLRKYHVRFNILTVLTDTLAKQPDKLYAFYHQLNCRYVQLIPCLPPLDEDPLAPRLSPQQFAAFYQRFFWLWWKQRKEKRQLHVGLFDNLILQLQGYPPQTCGMDGQCQCQNVVESDGSLYPCDFYVLDAWCCGKVMDTSLEEVVKQPAARAFLQHTEPAPCQSCPFQPLCHGNCKRMRTVYIEGSYCGYREFLLFAYPYFKQLIQEGEPS